MHPLLKQQLDAEYACPETRLPNSHLLEKTNLPKRLFTVTIARLAAYMEGGEERRRMYGNRQNKKYGHEQLGDN